MKEKFFIGLILLSGCLFLSSFTIRTKEVNTKYDAVTFKTHGSIVANPNTFTEQLFSGLDDNDLVVQVNHGGYLSSTQGDIEEMEEEFKQLNPNVNLRTKTVADAKKDFKNQLESYYASLEK